MDKELAPRAPVNSLMFRWRPVMSGLQGSAFQYYLVSLLVGDMEGGVECTFRKFADDTRLNDAVDTQSSIEREGVPSKGTLAE